MPQLCVCFVFKGCTVVILNKILTCKDQITSTLPGRLLPKFDKHSISVSVNTSWCQPTIKSVISIRAHIKQAQVKRLVLLTCMNNSTFFCFYLKAEILRCLNSKGSRVV